jgi:Tfp pilus assembly protein PilO
MKRQLPDLRENRATVLLALGLVLVLNLAWLLLINIPRGQSLQSAAERVTALSQERLSRGREVQKLEDAVGRILAQEQTLDVFFSEVISSKSERMVAIQREIRDLSMRHKINPNSIAYSHEPVRENDDLVHFVAEFPLKGSYQALRSFLRDVEHSENFLAVDGIDLTKTREGGVMLALNIRVSTLFRDPEMLKLRALGIEP